ncbi:hypothetical protein OOT46_26895 [Aquabacterium sp. A7-Y]|uniref:hypothetical protein n=1 Tax=Aquabacterium sp. A7-Y TaxID=1349605 RepID=UPI00223D2E50|nr:hypothetical protein [Aquabacterium sp. A7-Y]MCW7541441.1 hypothetical protein [Aquabacterium sp. A7-Y]
MKTIARPVPQAAWRLLAATVVVAAAVGWFTSAHAQSETGSATQTTAVQGVTMKVTPQPLASGATEWEFKVSLDAHSGSLDDDLAKTSALVVNGKEIAPTAWNGAASGGHHREGVLRFPAPAEPPAAVELRIRRAGESEPRVFRWDAAGLR